MEITNFPCNKSSLMILRTVVNTQCLLRLQFICNSTIQNSNLSERVDLASCELLCHFLFIKDLKVCTALLHQMMRIIKVILFVCNYNTATERQWQPHNCKTKTMHLCKRNGKIFLVSVFFSVFVKEFPIFFCFFFFRFICVLLSFPKRYYNKERNGISNFKLCATHTYNNKSYFLCCFPSLLTSSYSTFFSFCFIWFVDDTKLNCNIRWI